MSNESSTKEDEKELMHFNKGDACWLTDGRKAYYVGQLDGQHAVRPYLAEYIADDEMGVVEAWPGPDVVLVTRVFRKSPVAVFDDMIKARSETVSQLEAQIKELRLSVKSWEGAVEKAKEAASKYPDLARALDFIEGEITHVVIMKYSGFKVTSLQDALSEGGSFREKGLKLLSLFGNSKGKFEFKVNQYRDGSGSWIIVVPFKDPASANAWVCDTLFDECAAWRKDPSEYRGRLFTWLKDCDRFGFVIPDDVQDHIDNQKAQAHHEKVEAARAKLKELEEAEIS